MKSKLYILLHLVIISNRKSRSVRFINTENGNIGSIEPITEPIILDAQVF